MAVVTTRGRAELTQMLTRRTAGRHLAKDAQIREIAAPIH